jgi:hypothetical protein
MNDAFLVGIRFSYSGGLLRMRARLSVRAGGFRAPRFHVLPAFHLRQLREARDTGG